jgi:hypothetical protein
MTGILDRIRTTTVADLEGVRSDFDDALPAVYVRRVPKDMVRIVAGATDLRPTTPSLPNMNSGMVTVDPDLQKRATGEILSQDGRSDRQVELMDSLLGQLRDLDTDTHLTALAYTNGMTEHGKWTSDKEGTASRWIGRMITKVRELRSAARVTRSADTAPMGNADTAFQDIPNGYYAVADAGSDDIHYFRISRFRDGGIKVQEQASDELHPVRRGSRRTAILTTIQHVGPDAASVLYGQTIGRCGRCNRTLTDATSRAYGIGPDCRSKM